MQSSILTAHVGPPQPFLHEHSKDPGKFSQLSAFIHGPIDVAEFVSHSSTSGSKFMIHYKEVHSYFRYICQEKIFFFVFLLGSLGLVDQFHRKNEIAF